MSQIIKSIKGTQDVLPAESYKVRSVEQLCLEVAENYGFREIRTPVFEYTGLFQRSVGDTTDVVQKEMYTFLDKGERSITLRPEGTAGVVRSFLEHGLYNEPLPQKISYLTSCYRYEKPQAGRLREFHQFGIECFGSASPAADAEVISVANTLFKHLGVKGLQLKINSIGCPKCRAEYHKALYSFFDLKRDRLCGTCLDRLERNPMRILDCKSPICSAVCVDAPKVIDYLCPECREHFEKVKFYLSEMGIDYTVDPGIVRGLDYYTRTVFEFISNEIGAQGAVCAGGRYDGLVEQMGGAPMPALGFGMGIERLMLILQKQGYDYPKPQPLAIFIASAGQRAHTFAVKKAAELRENGISAQIDLLDRSIKAQMKYAGKIGAMFTVVIGDNELDAGSAVLKNMADKTQSEISLDSFAEDFYNYYLSQQIKDIEIDGLDIGAE